MKNDTCDDATDQTVSLNNESTPDAAVFSGAAPAPTSGASTIVLDTRIPPSGQN